MKHPSAFLGRQWVAKLAALVVVVAGTAAIAVSNIPEPADQALPHLPTKDVSSWSMPLDRYLVVNDDQEHYAELLLQSKCAAAQGVRMDVPWRDVTSIGVHGFGDAEDAGLGQDSVVRPLTVGTAKAVGYHRVPTDTLSSGLWAAYLARPPLTGAQQRVADSCLTQVRETELSIAPLSGRAQVANALAVTLANRALRDARRDPAVVSRERAWRTCMAPARVRDLPESPALMPSPSVANGFAVGLPTAHVSAGEKSVAVQDATCMTSTGYRAALYAADYRQQQRVTKSDLGVLEAGGVDQRVYAAKVDRVIAANLPPKPEA
ncbi:hypothetical protein AX769_19995 [Frondihabitans sp. PAMC 28766]|uniref:hypothetical protein n=1 Tax=Frondihabitans sp. PAMC 28766 TaxID=1795630 RepID=UPI00078B87F3|nr:hypothetical protein [Frondihabitans sp. PAMC 28766]AMM22010.1 hypothetical protein AX769_19995 [Frondihabitans sp. PAMC 28766]